MRNPRFLAIGVAFAVTIPLAACGSGEGATGTPPASTSTTAPAAEKSAPPTGKAAPARVKTTEKPTTAAKPKKPVKPKPATSDLSGLRITGIKAGASVLLDVADDGVDRFLAVGDNGRVDFTGTTRTDTTMMALYPAAVAAKNRVVIKPPFWNEEIGDGYCVADTAGAPLALEICKPGKASQIWRVQLAGDSGQFELHGAYGVISVDNGRINTTGKGRTGLQVLPYAE